MTDTPTALITGAARGLGRSLALAFARKGYAVGINYHRSESEAAKTNDEIRQAGGRALILKADVRVSSDVEAMVAAAAKEWGRIDALVNNAGIARDNTLAKMSDEEWRDVLAVILDGSFFCTRAILPRMRSQKHGSIINIGSYAAARGVRGAANYAAAKAGLVALTKCTALEEGPHNIRANAVLPGYHVTDMNRRIWEKHEEKIRAQHLLRDMPDREAMADWVVALSELKTVTGQVFPFESRLL